MNKNELIIDLRPYYLDLRPVRPAAVLESAPAIRKNRGLVRGTAEWLAYLAVFVALAWGTPAGLQRILHTEYPIASITSSSMWPELKRGDIVFIAGVDERADVAVGDIVVFSNNKGFTIHRVVKLNERTLITRGDANNVDDAPVGYDQLVGKAVEFRGRPLNIPHLGKLSQTVNKLKAALPLGRAVQAFEQ